MKSQHKSRTDVSSRRTTAVEQCLLNITGIIAAVLPAARLTGIAGDVMIWDGASGFAGCINISWDLSRKDHLLIFAGDQAAHSVVVLAVGIKSAVSANSGAIQLLMGSRNLTARTGKA